MFEIITGSKQFRDIVFWIGNVRRLKTFPWVTWDEHNPKVTHDEIDEITKLIQAGDVGIHMDEGFLSNLFIPGDFKHAWIHVDKNQVIEAISEGVLQRSCRYALRTDKLVILRPKLTPKQRLNAVKEAKRLVGFNYDVEFDFDLKEEFEFLSKHDQAFSCIEVVAYAYYSVFDQLGFKWTKHMGKEVLFPSCVLNDQWDIVYSNVDEIKTTI